MKQFELRPGFVILLCTLYMVSPEKWFCPFLMLLIAHELAHIFALYVSGIHVDMLRLTALGAQLRTAPMPWQVELLAALAGPAANLLLFIALLHRRPHWALLSLLLALFNLLPVYPLDGGRALRCALSRFLRPSSALLLERIVCILVWVLLAAAALWSVIRLHLGLWPVLLWSAVPLRALSAVRK